MRSLFFILTVNLGLDAGLVAYKLILPDEKKRENGWMLRCNEEEWERSQNDIAE